MKNEAPKEARKRKALGVLLVLVTLCVVAAAVAIPNFIHFQSRSKQAEAKSALKSILFAESEQFASHQEYASDSNRLELTLELVRYSCWLQTGKATWVGAQATVAAVPTGLPVDAEPGMRGRCPTCQFVAVCVGNIDNDPTADVWSIASFERKRGAETVAPGTPYCEVNDVED